jgi:hypothetical protein
MGLAVVVGVLLLVLFAPPSLSPPSTPLILSSAPASMDTAEATTAITAATATAVAVRHPTAALRPLVGGGGAASVVAARQQLLPSDLDAPRRTHDAAVAPDRVVGAATAVADGGDAATPTTAPPALLNPAAEASFAAAPPVVLELASQAETTAAAAFQGGSSVGSVGAATFLPASPLRRPDTPPPKAAQDAAALEAQAEWLYANVRLNRAQRAAAASTTSATAFNEPDAEEFTHEEPCPASSTSWPPQQSPAAAAGEREDSFPRCCPLSDLVRSACGFNARCACWSHHPAVPELTGPSLLDVVPSSAAAAQLEAQVPLAVGSRKFSESVPLFSEPLASLRSASDPPLGRVLFRSLCVKGPMKSGSTWLQHMLSEVMLAGCALTPGCQHNGTEEQINIVLPEGLLPTGQARLLSAEDQTRLRSTHVYNRRADCLKHSPLDFRTEQVIMLRDPRDAALSGLHFFDQYDLMRFNQRKQQVAVPLDIITRNVRPQQRQTQQQQRQQPTQITQARPSPAARGLASLPPPKSSSGQDAVEGAQKQAAGGAEGETWSPSKDPARFLEYVVHWRRIMDGTLGALRGQVLLAREALLAKRNGRTLLLAPSPHEEASKHVSAVGGMRSRPRWHRHPKYSAELLVAQGSLPPVLLLWYEAALVDARPVLRQLCLWVGFDAASVCTARFAESLAPLVSKDAMRAAQARGAFGGIHGRWQVRKAQAGEHLTSFGEEVVRAAALIVANSTFAHGLYQ